MSQVISTAPELRGSSHDRRVDASRRRPDARVGRAIPHSLLFLVAAGVAPSAILGAAADAPRLGVHGETALIASGAFAEVDYYRALARHLDVVFDNGERALSADSKFPESIQAGVAPLDASCDGPSLLLAPQGTDILDLLELARLGRLPRTRLAITTPSLLSLRVREKFASEVARLASSELNRRSPEYSARTPAGPLQIAFWAMFGFLLPFGLVFGGHWWNVLCLISGALIGGGILLRLFATAVSCNHLESASTPALYDHQLPVYTIAVALYHEEAVIEQLVRALERIDYPSAKLDIKLIIEADDIGTRDAIARLHLPPRYDIIEVPPGLPRTKPRALNTSLPLARGSLLVVFDAEDRPEPQQLRRAAERFYHTSGKLACLQAQLVIDNADDNWLTRLFAIEYAALFDVLIPGLADLAVPLPLGGTSNHFRVAALRDVAGWDAWNVTEDVDLGLRLARCGYQVGALRVVTDEEAPARLHAWLMQRKRWMKGWVQTLLTHSRNPNRLVRELGAWRAAASYSLIAGGVLGPLLGPAFGMFAISDALFGDLLTPQSLPDVLSSAVWIFLALTGAISALWPALLGMKRRGLLRHTKWLALFPFYYCLLMIAAWSALFEFFRDPYRWGKTEHGLARTSRRSQTQPVAPHRAQS